MVGNYKKESVELTFVYLQEGSDKTLKRINDYKTPHLDSMRYRYAECVQPHSYTRNECCRHPLFVENCQIFLQG